MVCEMENDNVEEMDIEGLSSMWPEDINDARKQLHIEKPGADQDMLKEIIITEEPRPVDFKRLIELTNYSEKGSSQLAYLVKNWEYRQANAVRLLREEFDNLSKQKQEVELKHLEILEEHRFEDGSYKRPISVLDVVYDILPDFPRKIKDVVVENKGLEIEAEYDTIIYWKQRAMHFEGLLEASIQREQIISEKLQESIVNLERQSSPVEELSQILKRADHYLHFILQTAPVLPLPKIRLCYKLETYDDLNFAKRNVDEEADHTRDGFCESKDHCDKLRSHLICSVGGQRLEEIIGKTDVEIFTGAGVKEIQDFKREVLERGLPAKREFTFETELFGSKTFLIYVEPVFSKAGDKIGVNYMGMEVTDQVRKREKMVKLREEIAVQKARETELNKTIHITEETMRAKQMLATMSHEIRSPLAGVVSMAEILSTTKLEKEQRQLLKVMLSSGDLVLQLINDILDLSKVESVCVLGYHSTSKRRLHVIGDVLRIRQILTNLISNAIKFTHEGKVGIKLYVVPAVSCGLGEGSKELQEPDKSSSLSQSESDLKVYHGPIHPEGPCKNSLGDESKTPVENGTSMDGGEEKHPHASETTVWICCDVYDTGIGIPENALPTLFKKYMQVSADTARKYGGTGLGLAICKQLVELMGGQLTVSSREHNGSTFTFVLPYKVSPESDNSDDPDEFSDMDGHVVDPHDEDISSGVFIFGPRTLGSLFSSSSSSRAQNFLPNCVALNGSHKLNGFSEDPNPFPGSSMSSREVTSLEDACLAVDGACSAVDGAETPCQQETSIRQSSDSNYKVTNCSEIQSQHKENGQFQDPFMVSTCSSRVESEEASEKVRPKDSQEEVEMQERSERSSQCSSSKGQEIIRSKLKPKILLVEDNKINVMVAQSMMTRFGHNIDVVNNGVEAVRAVQFRSYDLILMDVCMPVMDGLQATRLIRSFEETGNWDAAVEAGIEHQVPQNSASNDPQFNSSRNRIPIIAMTANALSESADECFANGTLGRPLPLKRNSLKPLSRPHDPFSGDSQPVFKARDLGSLRSAYIQEDHGAGVNT
ncbi:hypothetical protein RHGRI_021080 [Rhododendron griersonianum]|uniref:histidine kinase n=1 Tax=Rhododendron griersonianum TaxID=479676 RepID=A0AAV6JM47_9ERIC|nr:hypothetical protein RHGRI_021080 [Rhododendron griersonianum]